MEEGDGHAAGFAEAIRAWRQRRGWTQEELSHASGLSTRAIRSLERGRTQQPRRSTVQMLADALQVPRARLMAVRRAVAEADTDTEPDEAIDGAGGMPGSGDAPGRTRGFAGGTSDLGGARGFVGSGGGLGRARGIAGGGLGAATEMPGSSSLGGATVGRDPRIGAGVPRELPPDLADSELDVREVVAELVAGPAQPYRAAIVRVEASEVAIRAAHHASAKFPDGQLYASLADPIEPAALLRRFLRSLEVPARPAEATGDELAAAFRTALAGRRMLVVLVEAQSEAQIRPLIPAEAHCALLVAFEPHPKAGPEPA
ncbi:helix-turn-helix domain-containing protein [Catenulispora rubra]|uniref:helix-turn-helix domain-containing protein n=1 Tax=Catenulispora rubra TaxID=280293 RepID=UPI0018923988|nr:helix-turn-helix transcriptional regulator [Catenulispora rubra]